MADRRTLSRRALIGGAIGVAGAGLTAGASLTARAATRSGPPGSADVVTHLYEAVRGEVDLGGPTVTTWTYGGRLPGRELRVRAGETVQVRVKNQLPEMTATHWHGLRIDNAMDGVPGVTQPPIAPGGEFTYRLTPPDPGTYWLHAHHHLQLDRGLYAPLIVEDPQEPGGYDDEWVIVLDDWVDGTGRTPHDVYHHLKHGGHHAGEYDDPCLGYLGRHVGDVHDYPHYLINGRVPQAPAVFWAKPRQRVRLRITNAAADTFFRVALGGHTLRVTHTDGFPVRPEPAQSLLLAMGERFDAIVELDTGVFPLVAKAEGKHGGGLALVRTGGGQAPTAGVHPAELDTCPRVATDFVATDDVLLDGPTARSHAAVLTGDMMSYTWKINDQVFGEHVPLPVAEAKGYGSGSRTAR